MPFKSDKQRKWMHANEPEMANKWEKEESIKGKLRNLIKQEIKSINEGFEKYHLGGLLDSRLKKKLEIAIKKLKGQIDGVGDDWIWFRMPSSNTDVLTAFITKLDRNKNVWIGDKRKKNIWDRRQKINKLEATTTSVIPPQDTPKAFSKSTYNAIQVDDEDDEKKESVNEDNIKFSKEEMAQLHKDGKIEKDGHTIEFGESINESDLGLTYKKGKTVKVTHKKSGKELVIIDKPNVKREYEKIGYFAEGTVNEARLVGYDKSYLDNAKKRLKVPHEITDIEYKKTRQRGPHDKFVKISYKLKWKPGTRLDTEEKFVSVFYDSPERLKMIGKKLKLKLKESVNESPMSPFSSSEAKQHINQDIKKMSKHLGKASQQSIKIMMSGVKSGKYTAMDISRGIKEGPAGRAHFGELGFLQQLWNKVRDGFRRYSKDGKLS